MIFEWARSPVVRVRDTPAGVDQYGDPIPGAQVREPLPDALFAPTPSTVEITAGAFSAISQPTVYWPGEWPDVQLGDVLEIDGSTWQVASRPAKWPLGLAVTVENTEPVKE